MAGQGDAPGPRPPRAELRGLVEGQRKQGWEKGRGERVSQPRAPSLPGWVVTTTEGSQRSKNGLPPRSGKLLGPLKR